MSEVLNGFDSEKGSGDKVGELLNREKESQRNEH